MQNGGWCCHQPPLCRAHLVRSAPLSRVLAFPGGKGDTGCAATGHPSNHGTFRHGVLAAVPRRARPPSWGSGSPRSPGICRSGAHGVRRCRAPAACPLGCCPSRRPRSLRPWPACLFGCHFRAPPRPRGLPPAVWPALPPCGCRSLPPDASGLPRAIIGCYPPPAPLAGLAWPAAFHRFASVAAMPPYRCLRGAREPFRLIPGIPDMRVSQGRFTGCNRFISLPLSRRRNFPATHGWSHHAASRQNEILAIPPCG